jgi:hypothetical protein
MRPEPPEGPQRFPSSALDRALRGPGAHPPLERLAAAAGGELPAAETAAIEAHAAVCAACAAELDLARSFSGEPAEDADVRWVVERLRSDAARPAAPALADVLPMRRRPSPARFRAGTWAAAASVVLAAGLGIFALRDSRPPVLPERQAGDPVRGGEIVWTSPLGVVAEAPRRFSWEPVAGAAGYRIEILDVLGAAVATGEVREARWAPTEAQRAALESYVAYRVRLSALDAAGAELAGSVAELRVEPAP